MKTMREKFFDQYQKIQTPADNRRGFKTEYRYKGFWYAWELDAQALSREKYLFILTELVSVVILLVAATRRAELNSVKIAAGLAALSLIPYLAELYGVFRFTTRKMPLTESDYNEIRDCITVGSSIRCVLLLAGMIVGIITLAGRGSINLNNLLAAAGHLVSAAASAFILYRQGRRKVRTYRNIDGKVGPEL